MRDIIARLIRIVRFLATFEFDEEECICEKFYTSVI